MSMNHFLCRILYLLVLATLYSCGTTKDMVLLQNNPPGSTNVQELLKTIPAPEVSYKLQPKDRIMLHIFSLTDEKINFLKEPQIEKVIDNTGQIELPVMGNIKLAGLTIKQAEDTVKSLASDYLRSPNVTIKVMNYQVTVLGEVAQQGAVLAPDPNINLLQALGQAGGLTENANRKNIRIIRQEDKSSKIYQVNLLDVKSLSAQTFNLQPNDVVLVNPKKAVTSRQERLSTISLLVSLSTSLTFLVLQVFNNN